jgi:hypothetical protein
MVKKSHAFLKVGANFEKNKKKSLRGFFLKATPPRQLNDAF